MALKIRRGLETNRGGITPAEGEMIYTTDDKKVYIGDGSTAGGIPIGGGLGADGWADAAAMTWVSVDDPTGIFDYTGDVRATLSVGMRIKCTNAGNTVYGIITNVNGTLQSGNTRITFLHELDPSDSQALHLLADSAITNPKYSSAKAPLGFPLSPNKWTISVIDTSAPYQNSPSAGTWYNLGSLSISIPIGGWKVSYQAFLYAAKTSANSDQEVTLSTANNSASDITMTGGVFSYIVASALIYRERYLELAAKTTYYLNSKSTTTPTDINFRSDFGRTIIEAVCAYL
jgi:hypothetical protein